ncbi:hypothetical protein BD770DRAFT_375837 [Pilaira anomala]|nr:hypothetical protein BD770DRAFT_375837 [Pilaira anomala]
MGLHIKLPRFHFFSKKNAITTTEEEHFDDSMSTASTIAPSKSAFDSFLAAFSTEKFMNDPMRTSNHPEVVGYYYDPMSCARRGYVSNAGFDCTNTGA